MGDHERVGQLKFDHEECACGNHAVSGVAELTVVLQRIASEQTTVEKEKKKRLLVLCCAMLYTMENSSELLQVIVGENERTSHHKLGGR